MDINGIINVYKEPGYTSHDVVSIIRKMFQTKTGHTGTLDPDAEGVLPICLGKATKLADYIMADRKGYRAVLKLGVVTDTQDLSGMVLQESAVDCTYEEIKNAVNSFVGAYHQIPPMYSAIKIDGKKLYELAREGKEVERKSREVQIYEIQILNFNGKDQVEMDIVCSKGTYIRSLCHDIGQRLGCGGAMASLIRFSSGDFHINDAIKINEIKKKIEDGTFMQLIIPMEKALKSFIRVNAYESSKKYLYNGNKVNISLTDLNVKDIDKEQKYLVYDWQGRITGIYKISDDYYLKPITILQDFSKVR